MSKHKSFSSFYTQSEELAVSALLARLDWPEALAQSVAARAGELIRAVRAAPRSAGQLESFLQEYSLNTDEGLALMGLAEALLRIPDKHTAHALIHDKVAATNWLDTNHKESAGQDWVVKAAGVGLFMSSKTLDGIFARLGEPIIREAMVKAMQVLGKQFVLGQNMNDAMKQAQKLEQKGYRMSYDMLGEGARTSEDAALYYDSYAAAITAIGAANADKTRLKPGISVKLSALHPRYSFAQKETCIPALTARLKSLCRMAAGYNIALTVDAEESERLDISVSIITAILSDPEFAGWDGFGMAVQAYHKAALPLISEVAALARARQRRMQMRLVKGAYWDSEIKKAQIAGLAFFPVYTRKAHTDLSYLACAQTMFEHSDVIYPMFATHNAYSVAAILEMGQAQNAPYEFQRLFGMGEQLHDLVLTQNVPVSVYAPVGPHHDLLPYLVRRLLENGANSSFVNQILNLDAPVENLVESPVGKALASKGEKHPRIALSSQLFLAESAAGRRNSAGLDLHAPETEAALQNAYKTLNIQTRIESLGARTLPSSHVETRYNPAQHEEALASVQVMDASAVQLVFDGAAAAFPGWQDTAVEHRAQLLEKTADILEDEQKSFMSLLVREGGKTWADALAEYREAVDFLRYYAGQARGLCQDVLLPGPTGEDNILRMGGRGIFVCISPWNFPLAIFTGQIAAALVSGNCVIAKPAEQTPIIAYAMIQLFYKAGLKRGVLQLALGDGTLGAALVAEPRVAGVCFTGSTEVARRINQTLAGKEGPIVPLIAETGGQNAMIVDSSALPEQVVDDVLTSAFGSAGQRCSALRVLYLQEDNAERIIALLKGAMAQMVTGNPAEFSSDIGPIIDEDARAGLLRHCEAITARGAQLIYEAPLPAEQARSGYFLAPRAYEISDLGQLKAEVFGPVLHVIRYKRSALEGVLAAISATGYGLTLGVHSRIESFQQEIARKMPVGNIYVNRSMIGAVVGSQPFGGMGLSGTGPKAGGPHYLPRFMSEKVVSVNTTAAGGNASLVTLEE